MSKKGIIEFLAKSLREAADKVEGGDLVNGITDGSNAVTMAVALIAVQTDSMSGTQLYFDMVKAALLYYIGDLCKVFNKDPKVAWHQLSIIVKENCDGNIGSF